jgi:hypothetical protein
VEAAGVVVEASGDERVAHRRIHAVVEMNRRQVAWASLVPCHTEKEAEWRKAVLRKGVDRMASRTEQKAHCLDALMV